jgi:hypothetical protein
LHRTLGTGFFQKNRKTIFADGFCPGPSAQDFFQKNRKTIFAYSFCPGLSAQNFQKKNKIPLFADSPVSRPSAKKFSKTVILTLVNGYFFWPTARCGLSTQHVPRAWS